MLWNGSEEDGNVKRVRKMKALVGKVDGMWRALCIKLIGTFYFCRIFLD
jgi:hypothetical protein